MSPFFIGVSSSDDLLESSGDNSHRLFIIATSHGVCFATSCLPVREYCAIVSFQNILNKQKRRLLVYFCLSRFHSKKAIKCKDSLLLIRSSWPEKCDLMSFLVDIDNVIFRIFFGTEWPASNHHFHILRHFSL